MQPQPVAEENWMEENKAVRERERALRTEKTHATSSPQMKEKKRRKGEGRKEGSRCNPKKIGIAKSASSGLGKTKSAAAPTAAVAVAFAPRSLDRLLVSFSRMAAAAAAEVR